MTRFRERNLRVLGLVTVVLALALVVGALVMIGVLLFMLHVHAGDVAYIARTHRPIIIVPAGAPPVAST